MEEGNIREALIHLIEEGNIRKLSGQLAVDSANKDDLEAGLMYNEVKQLRDDGTMKHALEAARNRDYSTVNELATRIIAVENDLIAYQQNRDPFRRFCNPVDLVLNLGQIVVAIMILIHLTGEEHLQKSLFFGIIVYTCCCIANLPIICYRLCWVIISMDHLMYYRFEKLVEQLLVTSSLILFWFFIARSSSLNDTTQHIWLSLAFFAYIIIRYGIPNMEWIMAWLPLFVMELVTNFLEDLIPLSQSAQNLIMIAEFAYPTLLLISWCLKGLCG